MNSFDKFTVACAGICLILGFIAFGYLAYQIAGYISLFATIIFAALAIMGVTASHKEAERESIRRVRREYEVD